MTYPELSGKKVLVVDDEFLIGFMLADLLSEAGCIILGPVYRVSDAQVVADNEPLDLAVLDVKVAGVMIYPVAMTLKKRSIPFVLVTAYGHHAVPAGSEWPSLEKPFRGELLVAMLAAKAAESPATLSARRD